MGAERCVLGVGRADRGSLPALPEAVALPVHLQDVNAVGEPVQQGAGQPLRAEALLALVEGQVGRDQDGPPLVQLQRLSRMDERLLVRNLRNTLAHERFVTTKDWAVYQTIRPSRGNPNGATG